MIQGWINYIISVHYNYTFKFANYIIITIFQCSKHQITITFTLVIDWTYKLKLQILLRI